MTSFLKMAMATNIGNPSLFLDIQSLQKNIERLSSLSGQKQIRIATKSIRSLDVLKMLKNVLGHKFRGLMTYDLREAIWLAEKGFEDILMGYPHFDAPSLEIIHKSKSLRSKITLMVDSKKHLSHLRHYSNLRLCVDLDMSLKFPGLNFGVFRSSKKKVNEIPEILDEIKKSPHQLYGLMGYEAQIAGVPDRHGILTPLVKLLKVRSQKKIISFRANAKNLCDGINFFNGGGTGSIFFTVSDPSIDEITIGSGFYCPTLFDHYKNLNLTPSIYFSLPVVRKPTSDIITCLGGGYVASGSIGRDKLPTPVFPPDMSFISAEMGGEVQTPLKARSAKTLQDLEQVIFRPAKSGEICERFKTINAIDELGNIKTFNTYRGEGKCFY